MSGYCYCGLGARRARANGAGVNRRFRGAVESLIVPWLIWQPFYVVYNYRSYPVQLWSPIGVAWYLDGFVFLARLALGAARCGERDAARRCSSPG